MERKILISEIADFCLKYRLFNKSFNINEINNRIEKGLEKSEFIESLINTIIVKTRSRNNVDTEKLKELLLELEALRLELEYKDL